MLLARKSRYQVKSCGSLASGPSTIITAARVFSGLILLLHTALPSAASDRIVITGSSTVAPLLMEIGKRFEQQHPDVRVDVQTGGSTRGLVDARTGLADIGMISRALNPDEADFLSFTIANDGIGVILHATNPLQELSDQHVRDIYIGKLRNWNEVGGPDRPVTVVNKAEGRSTLELFLAYYQLRNSEIKPGVIIGDNQQGIKTVAGNPGAIGYVSIGAAEYEQQQGTPIKQLAMQQVDASVENVRNGSYPLSRPLNLVVWSKPKGIVLDFIQFAQSPDVVDLIEAQFFVPPLR